MSAKIKHKVEMSAYEYVRMVSLIMELKAIVEDCDNKKIFPSDHYFYAFHKNRIEKDYKLHLNMHEKRYNEEQKRVDLINSKI